MCYPYLNNKTTYYLGDSELWLDYALGQGNPIGSSVVKFIMNVFRKVMKEEGCFGLFAVFLFELLIESCFPCAN
jgi:hypothetical protein